DDCPFSVDIVVFALPTVDAGMDQDVCEGDSTMLSGTGTATDWSWDGGITNGVNFMPSAGTTTYTLTGTIDSTGCMATDEVDVTVIEVDETISVGAGVLIANQDGASYQWLECPDLTPVSGATGQEFTPPTDGDYAVAVDLGGCMDTSACQLVHVGIEDLNNAVGAVVYPNPTTDQVTVYSKGEFSYQVLGLKGEVIFEGVGKDSEVVSLKELPAGNYMINVMNDTGVTPLKVVKQ
ncbi:MAG: T9SS type A sorting domain-containing protein, partial [Flavobacteriales bacterium]|nr:T9SS type A sorting domain-containing protein [Flavobacteriales bacterium]